MDQILNQVLQSCRLSQELESSLPHVANNPYAVLASCEEVAAAFNKAVADLRASLSPSTLFDPTGQLILGETPTASRGFDLLSLYVPVTMPTSEMEYLELGLDNQETTGKEAAELAVAGGVGCFAGAAHDHARAAGGEAQTEYGGRLSGPVRSTRQRASGRRRESGETRTVTMPAVRTGNLDLPPDDGYTWRKYGQKAILGSKFTRSYYRCTHKNFYGCNAKKKVQRLDYEPNTYEITYCGIHTCHTSPTPLILPTITPMSNDYTIGSMEGGDALMIGTSSSPTASLSTSIEPGRWISRETEGGQSVFRSPFLDSRVGESSRSHVGPSEQPEQHGTRREGEESVSYLADVMFNSGSSSSSMDAIFTLKPEE